MEGERGIRLPETRSSGLQLYQKVCCPSVHVGQGYVLSHSSQKNVSITMLGIFKSHALSLCFQSSECKHSGKVLCGICEHLEPKNEELTSLR